MPTKEVKIIFLGLGVLLLLAAFMAYFYEMPQVGWYGFGSHPYFREYALPIGIVGIIVLIIGIILSIENLRSFVKG